MMETPPRIESAVILANTYLDNVKKRMRALFDNTQEGNFAREYEKTLEHCLKTATAIVDNEYVEIFRGNTPNSNDFAAARTIAVAKELSKQMALTLDDFVQGKGVLPPSQDV